MCVGSLASNGAKIWAELKWRSQVEGEESDTGYVRETKIYRDFNVKQGWKLPEEMRASKSSGGEKKCWGPIRNQKR